MGLGHSPSIVVDGLVFYIDPNNTNCYPGSGNTIYNLVNPSIGGTFVSYTSNPIDNTETRSIFFDGTNDFIQTNYIPYFTSDFTLEVFAKFTRYNDYQCILSSANNGGAGSGFWFEFGTGRGFTIYTTGSQLILEDNIVSLTNLELNKWHHIVATRSGSGTSNLKLYVNNILCGQNTSNAALGHTSLALMVGKYDYVGNYSYFKGNVGSVKIYNKGLNTDEILQNYNATKKKYDPDENIVTNGLVLHIDPSKNTSYPGTGNTIYDLSGSSNTGTLVSSPTFSSLNSGSLIFNGSSYITRSSALNTGQNFSVTAWIYPTSLGSRNAVVGNGYPFTTDNGWLFCICENNFSLFQALFLSIGQNNVLVISNSYVFQLNKWSHIACSVSGGGSSIKFYVNGVETSYGFTSGSGRTISYASNEFHVGMRHSSTTERFAGNISGVQIYNKTLSAQEIQQNYNATKNRFINALSPVRNGLVLELDAANRASYPGTGNTWYDLSGNGLNGTLANGPTFSGIGATSSIVFDGSNDRIDFGTVPANTTGTSTIGCWVKTTTTALCMTITFSSYGVMYINRFTTGKILAFFDGDTDNNTSADVSNTSVNDGSWHYLAATNNGTTCSMYIDGVLDKTYSETPSYGTSIYNQIAGQANGNNHMNGSISFAHIYNRALSAYEIKQNFDYYRTRYNI